MMQVDRSTAQPRPIALPPELPERQRATDTPPPRDQCDEDGEPVYVSPPPIPWPRVFPSL